MSLIASPDIVVSVQELRIVITVVKLDVRYGIEVFVKVLMIKIV